ncbi:FGGY family pentulose kinase [Pacificoceanicola onchidii]|uniref:FGGY family pentulose kinase n=1 Tax=Pacificoceanicola onchidii TaxID=2562685 RepID=UPI0010A60455|nr:FGGY family pentulose kinase [Pacificoceanicola onchidii]
MTSHVCAVDVGTRSARAGVFAADGTMLSREVCGFEVHEEQGVQAEYASRDIWNAVGKAVRAAVANAGVAPEQIRAIGFDATCSLVLLDKSHNPIELGPDGRDTIAWYDHRAVSEADECSSVDAELIRHLGQSMSPEMETPKLLWLKRHRPEIWTALGWAGDLADFLVLKATGKNARSVCTCAAKWPFLPKSGGWQSAFLEEIGLEDLLARADLPDMPISVGDPAGHLTKHAANHLGLSVQTVVAAGMIDAFAGALGTQGLFDDHPKVAKKTLITGTSNCIMSLGDAPLYRSGIWGPYHGAVLPGYWVSEGGQSAAGALLDYLLESWPTLPEVAKPSHSAVLARLQGLLDQHGPSFGKEIHILPDFNGNRAPLSDPMAKGVISGLTLDRSFDGLCALYWRAAVSLALGVRQILEHIDGESSKADLAMVGGFAQSDLLTQLFADATGQRVLRPIEEDTVLLGAATAAFASLEEDCDLTRIARRLAKKPTVFVPSPVAQDAHGRDYKVFLTMQAHRDEIAALTERP